MKRFRFRLEKVLSFRKHREREWELKLADITGKCLLLENAIRRCETSILSSFDDRRAGEGALDAVQFMQYELYMARMKQEIRKHREDLVVRHREREEIRKGYLEAAKKRKVLDKLKERRGQEYYLAAKREEFNVMDEINNSALIRAELLTDK
jgi:flagellar FliJ protein